MTSGLKSGLTTLMYFPLGRLISSLSSLTIASLMNDVLMPELAGDVGFRHPIADEIFQRIANAEPFYGDMFLMNVAIKRSGARYFARHVLML